jgi:hypothetical protein
MFFPDPDTARQSDNDWLRDRCIDIALYFLATLGSREPSDAQENAYTDARAELEQVRLDKLKVPRLTIPDATGDINRFTSGVPRVLK